jgi:ribosomal-protein-alanine N-acetyltransferase
MLSFFSGPEAHFVRPLRHEHIPACMRIHAAAFARGWEAGEFEALLQDKTVLAHALTDGPGQRVAGFALSRRVLDEAELLTIAVDAARRGGGLGRQLLATHLETLAAAGVRTVFLEVEEANAPACALYARAGFVRIGQREGYYLKADGTRARALVLRRNQ